MSFLSFPDILLQNKLLTKDQYHEIEEIQEKSDLPIEKILQRRKLIDEMSYLQLISKTLSYPLIKKIDLIPNPIFDRISLDMIEKYKIIPFDFRDKTLSIAMCSHRNMHLIDDLMHQFAEEDLRIQCYLATEEEIMRVLHINFDKSIHAAKELMSNIEKDEYTELETLDEDTLDLGNEAPVIKMVNAIITRAMQERATDIHIEPSEKDLNIRYRIDGVLHERMKPPKTAHLSIVSRIKIMANLNIAENRMPQDGRIKIRLSGQDVDIRVSVFPTHTGERIVLRLLSKTGKSFLLKNLELEENIFHPLKKMIHEANGIILVTGPTGSGKSTTLYAILSELNDGSKNILTAEDPVEYQINGIGQMQIHDKIGLTFAHSLRSMLRQDPDVIMVGEIRDQETARIAIQASLTGHLVLSTLHTNDATSSITRLVDMGIEPYLITSTVRGVLAQRLLRKICPHCKKPHAPTKAEMAEFHLSKPQESKTPQLEFMRGEGCEKCVFTGYFGLIGIYSLLTITPTIEQGILQHMTADQLLNQARQDPSNSMQTLAEYGYEKVAQGITTIEEVMRVT